MRLRGDYVAIVTLAFGEIIGQVAANGGDVAVFGRALTAGPNNIGPIKQIDLPFLGPSMLCTRGPGTGSRSA